MSGGAFSDVDSVAAPEQLVHYLDVISSLDSISAYKRLTFDRLELNPGVRVLDVGCGTGDDVAGLASLVQPAGQAVGIDVSETMVAEARRRAANAELLVGDVHRLPFDDESFDRCRADRTLMHVADVDVALAEMHRVTRRGGRIVVSEPDWDTLAIDTHDRVLTRQIAHAICDSHRNGWIGRQLSGLLGKRGFVSITIDPVTLVMTDPAVAEQVLFLGAAINEFESRHALYNGRVRAWQADLDNRASDGRFFVSLTGFIVAGCKP